jgi:hypothetical protein
MFSNAAFWASMTSVAVALGIIFAYRSDLARLVREGNVKALSSGVGLVLLTVSSAVLMMLAFLLSVR